MQNLKKTIIVIHGAGPKHYRSLEDGSGDWQAQLPLALGDSYQVIAPQMPSPKNPSFEEWKILLDKNLARIRGEVTFVGHSLGASFLLRYLSEVSLAQRISGLFLVAAPFNTVKGFEAPHDFSRFHGIKHLVLYHSMDDVEVPYAHALIFRQLLNAKLKTYADCGHFFKRSEFADIVRDIKSSREEFSGIICQSL